MSFFIMAFSCNYKKQDKKWDVANINANIGKNSIYRKLDNQDEIFSVFENPDSLKKRTSGVSYFTKGHVNLLDSNSASQNNCRASYLHNNTLSINIGIGNGFTAWGFIIHYKDKKFYTEPYYSTDLVIPNEPEPIFKVIFQKLTLDKTVYKIGDSLYGMIDFKSIEIEPDGNKIKHSGNGYFRTTVKEL